MTVRAKAGTILAVLVCANLAIWGARDLLGVAIDPIIRALGAS